MMDQLVVPNSLEHSQVHATCGRDYRDTEWIWDTLQPHHQHWSAETWFAEMEDALVGEKYEDQDKEQTLLNKEGQ